MLKSDSIKLLFGRQISKTKPSISNQSARVLVIQTYILLLFRQLVKQHSSKACADKTTIIFICNVNFMAVMYLVPKERINEMLLHPTIFRLFPSLVTPKLEQDAAI